MACSTCGRTLLPDSWGLDICSAECLDRFVDVHVLSVAAPAQGPVTLERWVDLEPTTVVARAPALA